jgi:hypothetical protein
VLQKEDGNAEIVPPDALTNLFRIVNNQKKIQCVILNACYAEKQAEAIAKYVPCTIGMSTAISDTAAMKFATSFYRGLGYGRSVNDAFELGCNELAIEGIPEESTPRLKYAPDVDPSKIYLVKHEAQYLYENIVKPSTDNTNPHFSELLDPTNLDDYEKAWGGYTGTYCAFNPTYTAEDFLDKDKLLNDVYLPRYNNTNFEKAMYLIFHSATTKDNLNILQKLIDAIYKKLGDVLENKLEIRLIKEKSPNREYYLGIKNNDEVVVLDPRSQPMMSGPGLPSFVFLIKTKNVVDTFKSDFKKEWLKGNPITISEFLNLKF